MRRYFIVIFFLVILIPYPVKAAWWNFFIKSKPEQLISTTTTDFENTIIMQANRIEVLTEEVNKLNDELNKLKDLKDEIPNKVPVKIIDNPVDKERIAQLNALVKELQKNPSPFPTTIASTTTSDERIINIKLAELDKLDWDVDHVADNPLLEELNSVRTIEGKRLFDTNNINLAPYLVTIDGALHRLPPATTLHYMISTYRNSLKINLEEVKKL